MTKRDKFSDFNKAMNESKAEKNKDKTRESPARSDKNGKVADGKEIPKDAVNEKDEEERRRKENGIRIYTIPKKDKKKPKPDKNKVDTGLNTRGNKDSDDMELGAEASNIKEEKKDDDEEKQKVIEVHTCWPVFCAKK